MKVPIKSSSVHPAFRGRQHSRRRIYLKRKYCTIVTSQPSREDREIEKEKVALSFFFFLTSDFCFFFQHIIFSFLFVQACKVPSVTDANTHTKNHRCVCVFVAFFSIFCTGCLCVCVCVWGGCHGHTHTCR